MAALRAAIILLAVPVWMAGCALFGVALLLTLAARRLDPSAMTGNCWSFAGPRWVECGGYLAVRFTRLPTIFGRRFIPHALWVPSLVGVPVEQTEPLHRYTRLRDVWRMFIFDYRIRTKE